MVAHPPIPCLCASLRRASRAVTRIYEQHLAPLDITVTQHTILRVLHAAGPLPQHALADVLIMDSTTLTRTLAPLRENAWITRQPTEDHRVHLWALTPAGKRMVEKCADAWNAAQNDLKSLLGEQDWISLRDSLLRLGSLAA